MIIDQLTPTASDNLTDEVPVEQGQLTFKTTWQKIKNLFLGNTALPTTAQTISGAIAELSNGKVSKAGDTMTGDLTIDKAYPIVKSSQTDGTTVSSDQNGYGYALRDSQGILIGYFYPRFYANGNQGVRMVSQRDVSGTMTAIRLEIGITPNGTRYVDLGSSANAWMDALAGANTTTTSTISNIATAGTGVTITTANYAQWGKLAQVSLVLSKSSAISSQTTVAVLVSGKRPAIACAIVGNNGQVLGNIQTNGNVNILKQEASTALAANTSVTLRATYLLA